MRSNCRCYQSRKKTNLSSMAQKEPGRQSQMIVITSPGLQVKGRLLIVSPRNFTATPSSLEPRTSCRSLHQHLLTRVQRFIQYPPFFPFVPSSQPLVSLSRPKTKQGHFLLQPKGAELKLPKLDRRDFTPSGRILVNWIGTKGARARAQKSHLLPLQIWMTGDMPW